MKFEYPVLLFILTMIPVLAVTYVYLFRTRKRALDNLGHSKLIEKLSAASPEKQKLKAALIILGVFFLIIALARPQFGTKLVEVKQSGTDVVLAVDVSASMLAEDVKPNRLERAKLLLSELISQLEGNKVGIVAFSGTAFWQCPLTLDLSGANMFLQLMNTSLIPLGGTAIGDAIRVAAKGLIKTAEKSKTIVLLTDGEDHKSNPIGAAEEAAKGKIKIYTLGIGSKNGEPIPIKDENGKFIGYKKDKNGNVVMSKMNEADLIKIADVSGGQYFDMSSGQADSSGLLNAVIGMEKSKLSSKTNRQYEDRFQYPLFLGLIFLIVEFFIPGTRKRSQVT